MLFQLGLAGAICGTLLIGFGSLLLKLPKLGDVEGKQGPNQPGNGQSTFITVVAIVVGLALGWLLFREAVLVQSTPMEELEGYTPEGAALYERYLDRARGVDTVD